MIHATPPMSADLQASLEELDRLRFRLAHEVGQAQPWTRSLRRHAQVESVVSSTRIEGYEVSADDAQRLVADYGAADDDDSQRAVASYAHAMQHVAVMSDDPTFNWSERIILDLHFDACSFQRNKQPGRWRSGPVYVLGASGQIEYTAPDVHEVAPLMTEIVAWLRDGDLDAHVVVRAAMAHLHIVSVHPFADGNGRVSRLVQSLVLAREGLLSPDFGSIEPYLAEHTLDYYAKLNSTHGATFDPSLSASEWVTFCVDAHIAQAQHRLTLIDAAAARWRTLEDLAEQRQWPDRLVIALEQTAMGGTTRRRYVGEAEISWNTATSDFRRLADAGFVTATGAGPSTRYVATDALSRLIAQPDVRG